MAGIEMLNTQDPARQPVKWFSNPSTDLISLPTWLTEQYRYLDITTLVERAGWQLQLQGDTLQLSTPTAQVQHVYQERMVWGDRLVIALDHPTPWQMTEEDGAIVVTIDAQSVSPQVSQWRSTPGRYLTSLTWASQSNQTILRLKAPPTIRASISTLPSPNRLIINLRPEVTSQRDILWSPGIRWHQTLLPIGTTQFPVTYLEIDPRQRGLQIRPIWANPNSPIGIAPLNTMAQQWHVAAAINGGFFNRNNQLPLGAIRRDGRWLSGPILNRGAIAWNDTGEVLIDRLGIQETITPVGGQTFPITLFNTAYVRAGLARYTPDWGPTYTNILDNELIFTVRNHQIVEQQSTNAQTPITLPIPADGYLLVARSFNTVVSTLSPGNNLQLMTRLTPPEFDRFPQIIGAGPLLLKNRQIVLNPQAEQFSKAFIQQSAPRSAIGKTAQGNLILVTIQNRLQGSGPTLSETAQVMQNLGAIDALNLDGGSSTTLYLGGQLLNLSPHTAAQVHNGIGISIHPNF
jgi:hypothetical protein